MREVAIIGAGLAGLACARALREGGLEPAVFEKSRGLGGRMATRRAEGRDGAPLSFDHGAQYFTARSAAFQAAVSGWVERGWVSRWLPRLAVWDGRALQPKDSTEERYVARPGMSALARQLAEGVAVHTDRRLARLEREGQGWLLHFDDGSRDAFRRVLLALPAPQAATLLPTHHPFQAQAADVEMAPCWAVLAAPAEPLALEVDGCFCNAGPLSWFARNSSKPDRPGADAWVLHGSAAWSRAHLEAKPVDVVAELLAAFEGCTGARLDPLGAQSHRWRYALADRPLAVGSLWDPEAGLGLAGDWLAGSRVEGAWTSGSALAAQLLGAAVGAG